MSLTYKEITGQYDALKKTFALFEEREAALKKFVDSGNFPMIAFIGCGSSFSLATSMAVTTQMKLARPAVAIAGGDLVLHIERYRKLLKGALLVAISRSGSTSEILNTAEALKSSDDSVKLLSFTCVENSKLTRKSDLALDMPWAFDESVCQTRTVTNLYLCGALFAAILSGDQSLKTELKEVIFAGDAYLQKSEPALREAAALDWDRAVVLGDAELAGICEEGALTFKEICQLDSNYYHVLDARHGPIVMFKPETLVIVAMSDPENEYEQKLIRDVLAKGCKVVVYSDLPCGIENVINIVFGTKISHISRGIPFILIPQLITYYKSLVTGTDPDKPEGLAPWIEL